MRSGLTALFQRSQIILGSGALLSVFLLVLLLIQERQEVSRTFASINEVIHRGTRFSFQNHFRSLNQVVRHWEEAGDREKASWQADIESYLKDHTGAKAVASFSTELALLWSILLSQDDQVRLENTLQRQTAEGGTIQAVIGSASPGFIIAPEFFKSESGVAYIVPVRKGETVKELLVTVFDFRSMMAEVAGANSRFCITLLRQRSPVVSVNCSQSYDENFAVSEDLPLDVNGSDWSLQLIPHNDWVSEHTTLLPWIVFLLGALTTYALARSQAGIGMQREAEDLQLQSTFRTTELEEQILKLNERLRHRETTIHEQRTTLASITQDSDSEKLRADVAERNRMYFFTLLTVANDSLIGVDLNGDVTSWNIGAKKLFGKTAEQMKKKSLSTLMPSSAWEGIRARIQQISRGEPVSPFTATVRARNEKILHVEVVVVPTFGKRGTVEGAHLLLHDLSAEQESNRQFRALIDAAPLTVLQLEASGAISLCSRETLTLFGFTREELQGKVIDTLFEEDFWSSISRQLESLEGADRERRITLDRIVHGIKEDGTRFAASVCAHHFDRGEDTYVLLYVNDESHVLSLEESIKQSKRQLHQFLTAIQSRFLPDVQVAQKALTALKGDAHTKQFVKEPLLALRRSEELASNINEYKSFDHPVVTTEKVHLNVLVSDVIRRLEKIIQEKDILIEFDTPLPHLQASKQYLSRIYEHLLRNAVQHGSPRQGSEIHLGVKEEKDARVFYVKDQGPGIKEEDHQRIFNLFETADSKTSGSGVGLAIVKRMIDSLGGSIWIEGIPGKGNIFYFRLPRLESEKKK